MANQHSSKEKRYPSSTLSIQKCVLFVMIVVLFAKSLQNDDAMFAIASAVMAIALSLRHKKY